MSNPETQAFGSPWASLFLVTLACPEGFNVRWQIACNLECDSPGCALVREVAVLPPVMQALN